MEAFLFAQVKEELVIIHCQLGERMFLEELIYQLYWPIHQQVVFSN